MKKTLIVMALMAAAQAFAGLSGSNFYINNATKDNTAEDHATVYANYADGAYTAFTLKDGKSLTLVPGDAHAATVQAMTLNDNSSLSFGSYNGSASGTSYLTDMKLGTLTMAAGSQMIINTATTVRIDSLTQATDAKIKVGNNATVLVKVTPGSSWNDLSKIELTGTQNARKGYTVSGSIGGDGLQLEAATGNVIELNGVSGTLGGSGETVVTKDLILTNSGGDAAALFSTINGSSYTFKGAISGNGNFVFNQAGKQVTVTLDGDLSGWETATNNEYGGFRNAQGEVTVNMNYAGIVKAAFNVHTLNIGADATLNKYVAVTDFSVAAEKTVATVGHFAAESVALEAGAHLTLDTSDASRTINSLTLGAGSEITLSHNGSHAGKALVTSSLTVAGDSTMNADLVMNSGTMNFTAGAVLTMGCSVTIGDTVEVHISGADAEAIRHGSELTIINLGQLAATDVITLGSASIYIDNVEQNDFSLMRVEDADGTSRIVVAPEPATATLSLLALAGLCARRRRH